jgi:hypothetical protein
LLAIKDHLVGNLDKEAGHPFVSVIVTGNSVNHLNRVHQDWKCLFDRDWISIVKGFYEALEGLQVFDVVLSFVQIFGDSELDASPVGQGKVDTAIRVAGGLALAHSL